MSREQSPEDVERAFLEAERDVRPSAQLMTGELRDVIQLEDLVVLKTRLSAIENHLTVRRISTAEMDADVAILDVDAHLAFHIQSSSGVSNSVVRVRGPLELRRETSGWRIASFVGQGERRPECHYRPFVDVDDSTFRLRVHMRRTRTYVYVLAALEARADVELTRFEVGFPVLRLLRGGVYAEPQTVKAGQTLVARAGFRPGTAPVEFCCEIDSIVRAFRFLPPARAPRWWRRLSVVGWLQLLIIALLPLALGGAWIGFGSALCLAGGFLAVQGFGPVVNRVRTSAAVAALVVGTGEMVAGILVCVEARAGLLVTLTAVAGAGIAWLSRGRPTSRFRTQVVAEEDAPGLQHPARG